jgi:glycosyltransferase involved in cell wall biosynthesis
VSTLASSDSVSVVIGSYNAAEWIGSTVESILGQTHPIAEIVVVDDGSTDQTAEIARSYGTLIRVVQEEHRGRPRRNRGIEISRGALVAFMDADDLWHPGKIERQVARLRDQRSEWVVCEAEWLDSATGRLVPPVGKAPTEGDILERLFLHNFIVASTPIISRRVLEAAGGFNESADVAPVEDWDLWLRIAASYPLACVPEQLATLRLHGDSFLASTPLARRVQSLENVISRAAAREPKRLGPKRARALHNAYFAAGVSAIRQGRAREARSYFLMAWGQQPGDAAALAYVGLSCMSPAISSNLLNLKRRFRSWR